MPKVELLPAVDDSASKEAPPFLLSTAQGEAARALLAYTSRLPLTRTDTQLLATVIAIRAARGGSCNLLGTDVRALRLVDAPAAIADLEGLGWTIDGDLFDDSPQASPAVITVPELADDVSGERALPFGKGVRSRVSGWVLKCTTAKLVKKLTAPAKLAALFAAAHGSAQLHGTLPPHFPPAYRAALEDLLAKGFLTHLEDDSYQLDTSVRNLTGLGPRPEHRSAVPASRSAGPAPVTKHFTFDPAAWTRWKEKATPALRRHVEAVENCTLCDLRVERIAESFTVPPARAYVPSFCGTGTERSRRPTPTAAPRPRNSRSPSAPSTATAPPSTSCARAWVGTSPACWAHSSWAGCSRTSGSPPPEWSPGL